MMTTIEFGQYTVIINGDAVEISWWKQYNLHKFNFSLNKIPIKRDYYISSWYKSPIGFKIRHLKRTFTIPKEIRQYLRAYRKAMALA